VSEDRTRPFVHTVTGASTEIFFALEMIVKRALGYTRGFGNVLHAGGIESSLVQDLQARV